MSTHYHIYECEDCAVVFAVEQAFEDQSVVKCPVCLTDDSVWTIGTGRMEAVEVSPGQTSLDFED